MKKAIKPMNLSETAGVKSNAGGVVYVSTSGNDTTGRRGNISLPFLTPAAAVTAASSGDTVCFFAGSYSSSTNLYKAGVSYTTIGKVSINSTRTTESLFYATSLSVNFVVDGDFIFTSSANVTASVFNISGSFSAGIKIFIRIISANNAYETSAGTVHFRDDNGNASLVFIGDVSNTLGISTHINMGGNFFGNFTGGGCDVTIATIGNPQYVNIFGTVGTLTNANASTGGKTCFFGGYASVTSTTPISINGDELTQFNRQTDSYTLLLTDRNLTVEMNKATANNLTVPPNSSAAFAIGTKIPIIQYGAGQTTVVAGSGVTIRSAGAALKLRVQYSPGMLEKIGTNEWYFYGDITV